MNCENSILIRAPLSKIFAVTSDLENWPRVLPHYRWIRKVGPNSGGWVRQPALPTPPVGRGAPTAPPVIVQMAARRGWLPIKWTSRFEVADGELRFHHLKAFTRGMDVKWTFTQTEDGVLVCISHELNRWYAGLLARYFIVPVASRTLAAFKAHLEGAGPPAPPGRGSAGASPSRRP